MTLKLVVVVALLAVVVGTPTLRLRRGDFALPTRHSSGARELTAWHEHFATQEDGHKAQMVVHVSYPSKEQSEGLEAVLGRPVTAYMADNSYIVYMTKQQAEEVSKLDFVHWVGLWHPSFKTDGAMDKLLSRHRSTQSVGVKPSIYDQDLMRFGNKKVLKLVVSFVPDQLTVKEAQNEVFEWEKEWRSKHGGSDTEWLVMHASEHAARVAVLPSSAPKLVDMLRHRAAVHFVDQHSEAHKFNSESTRLVQSDTTTNTPLWDLNMTGAGEIIGMGDTGLDVDNVFFKDTNNNNYQIFNDSSCNLWTFFTTSFASKGAGIRCPTFSSTPLNPTKRKIVGYWAFSADSLEPYNGHGSHVAGTVLGDPYSGADANFTAFRGAAYEAKMLVADLNNEALFGSDGSIASPPDMDANFFPYFRNKGSFIQTNSWGGSTYSYGSNSVEIDRYGKSAQDFLILFAAGNGGPNGLSLGPESNCKNCIVVGSHETTPDHFNVTTPINVETTDLITSPAVMHHLVCQVLWWNKSNSDIPGGSALAYMNLASNALSGGQGTAQEYHDHYCNRVANDGTATVCCQLEAASSSLIDGRLHAIMGLFGGKCCASEIETAVNAKAATAGTGVLSSFSSWGPAVGNRLKPDFVAAGEKIISARGYSDGITKAGYNATTYPLLALQGTSMATPVVAGAAALVRQFYTKGFAECGSACGSSVSPSWALVKATMMVTTVNLDNVVNVTHYNQQGYGKLKLSEMLRTNYSSNSVIRTMHWDISDTANASFKSSGQVSCVDLDFVLPGTALTAALVWADPAGTVSSSSPLVNNLDLYVTNNSTTYYGNHFIYGNTRDTTNTNEKVILNSTQGFGNLTKVCVQATSLPVQPQGFALVVRFHENYPISSTPEQQGQVSSAAMAVPALLAVLAIFLSLFMM